MDKPVRVLQVLGGLELGGAESRVMDSYRHMDRDRIQFDFCIHTDKPGAFEDEIEKLGGCVYRMPRFKAYNYLSYRKAWKKFFMAHPDYQAVHGHMTSTASIYLPIAKKSGVPVTMAHARSAGVDPGLKGRLTRFLRRKLSRQADLCLTCSRLAGEAVYGKAVSDAGKVLTIPNAIDAQSFTYCEAVRNAVRSRYGIGDEELVIGHVGRFGHMKNHLFLVEVFALVHAALASGDGRYGKRTGGRLLLVGEGSMVEQVRAKAESLGVADRVIFAGAQREISDYYQAMDYFVFPSLFEGLPGSVVEAQASGLKCLVSNQVTDEVLITPLAQALSLECGPQVWAQAVLDGMEYEREQMAQAVKQAGFDVSDQVKMLEKLYLINASKHV